MSEQLAEPVEGEEKSLPLHVSVCERRYRDTYGAIKKLKARMVRLERKVSRKLNWLITVLFLAALALIGNLFAGLVP